MRPIITISILIPLFLLMTACGSSRSNNDVPRQASKHATYYTIKAGDTLGEISQKFYGTMQKWKQIAQANKLNPRKLQVGQRIVIPHASARTYNKHSDFRQSGKASFYADKFQGRKTASGERYDHKRLTVAHRTLPFGTRLNVKNMKNGKFVQVVVNDRGPFVDGRIIDLSLHAAQAIGMVKDGTVPVEITIVD